MVYRLLIFGLLLAFCSSCRIILPSEMFKTEKDFPLAEFEPAEKEYRIKPFDILEIVVTTNDGFNLVDRGASGSAQTTANSKLGFEYAVEHDGLIKLPTLGRIKLDSLTVREAEKFLEKEYSRYYKAPFVLIKNLSRKVYIFKDGGTVAQIVDIPETNMTLIEAIAQTGGLSNASKSYKIRLIRGDLNNNPRVYEYNLYMLKNIEKANLLLEANDIIYIESRPQYVNKVLAELSPYLNLISTVILIYSLFIVN